MSALTITHSETTTMLVINSQSHDAFGKMSRIGLSGFKIIRPTFKSSSTLQFARSHGGSRFCGCEKKRRQSGVIECRKYCGSSFVWSIETHIVGKWSGLDWGTVFHSCSGDNVRGPFDQVSAFCEHRGCFHGRTEDSFLFTRGFLTSPKIRRARCRRRS